MRLLSDTCFVVLSVESIFNPEEQIIIFNWLWDVNFLGFPFFHTVSEISKTERGLLDNTQVNELEEEKELIKEDERVTHIWNHKK